MASPLGKELTSTSAPGSHCKRTSLAFFAPLTTRASNTPSTAAASSAASTTRIQKGLIRYLYIVIDLSKAALEMDFRPSRTGVVAKHVEAFIREFFYQNSLSQVGLVTIEDGVAHILTDLGGSPESHVKALMGKLDCSGDASLENALDLVQGYLNQIPSFGHGEVLIMYSALSCDPGDIMETIQNPVEVHHHIKIHLSKPWRHEKKKKNIRIDTKKELGKTKFN